MSIIEDMFKGGNIGTGLAVGIGAAVVAPAMMVVLRPLSRAALRAGVVAYDQGRAMLADMNEWTSDQIAEVRADMAQSGNGETTSAAGQRRSARRRAEPKSATPSV